MELKMDKRNVFILIFKNLFLLSLLRLMVSYFTHHLLCLLADGGGPIAPLIYSANRFICIGTPDGKEPK